MKLRNLFCGLLAAAALIVSCEPKEEDFGEPSMDLSASELTIPMDGGSVTLQLTCTRDWMVKTDADWVLVDPESGAASKSAVTVTITAPKNDGFDRTAEIEFYGGKLADEFVTVSQPGKDGDPDAVKAITCAEFAALPDDDGKTYQLSGTISGSINTTYGNFDVTDETGSVYVYGCTNADEYAGMLKSGNKIVVEGPKTTYNSKVEMKNATILSVEQGEGPVTPTSIKDVTCAEFISAAVSTDAWYRLSGTVSGSINTTYGNFDIVDETGTVYVYGTSNFSDYSADFAKGGKVTFVGQRGDYNGKVEALNGYIEKYEKGEDVKPMEGTSLIKNGGFEDWTGDKPANWAFSSGNATLTKSSDAYKGSNAAEIAGSADQNKRMMSDVYTLKAGTYQFAIYVKGSGSFRLGYALITDGKVKDTSNDYKYITDAAAASSDWKQVFETFTLSEQTDISLIIMNSKNGGGASVLVDEVTLITNDGGVIDGGGGTGSGSGESTGGETPTDITDSTVEQFLAAAESTTKYYRLTGEVKDIKSTTYGNFTLVDATGSVYVYGLTSTCQPYDSGSSKWTNDKSFSSLGIKAGDTVTIVGTRGSYNETIEVCGAYCEKVVPGQGDGGSTGGEESTNEFSSTITWTLGTNAYDKTSGDNAQTATVNGKSVSNLLKLGTSKSAGDATLTIPAGTTKIGFYAVGWKGSSSNTLNVGDKSVSVSANTGAAGNPPYTMTVSDSDYYTVEVAEGSVKITCDTRVIVFGITAK